MPSIETNLRLAAELRQQAANLVALAQRQAEELCVLAAAMEAGEHKPNGHAPADQRAAVTIRQTPQLTGKLVADAIGVSYDHFRRDVWPKLVAQGFRNLKGGRGCVPPNWTPAAR